MFDCKSIHIHPQTPSSASLNIQSSQYDKSLTRGLVTCLKGEEFNYSSKTLYWCRNDIAVCITTVSCSCKTPNKKNKIKILSCTFRKCQNLLLLACKLRWKTIYTLRVIQIFELRTLKASFWALTVDKFDYTRADVGFKDCEAAGITKFCDEFKSF